MKTQDDLDRQLERFYQVVAGEVPAAPPAWTPDRPARGSRLKPVLAAGAIAVFSIGLALSFRQLHLARRAPAAGGQPAAQAPALSMGAVQPGAMWLVRRTADNTPPSAGGVPRPEQDVLQVTTDGGRTWQPRLTFTGVYDGMSWSADGKDGVVWAVDWPGTGCVNTTGKVTCSPPTNALRVYVTTDGGLHWIARTPTSWPAQYVYFRDREGWAVSFSENGGAATPGLYHTADAGVSWQRLGGLPPRQKNGHTSGVGENTITFVSSQIGWYASEEIAQPGDSGLYLTRDGGRTWTSQSVQPPAGMTGYDVILGYPQVLRDGRLALPVRFGHPTDPNNPAIYFSAAAHYLYISTDGGLTWGNPVRLRAGSSEPKGSEYLDFYLDASHWWFTTNNDHPSDTPIPKPQALARTADGGKTWQVFQNPAIFQMMFSDANSGWAEAEAQSGSDYINILLRTTDGGAHWQQVAVP
ncbi:MAG TPA: sialidase family protein [Candidatus Limnocylindrales bacterium]|nr:sialidase family protein [Candidatus Limnocylindrales bacterium]